MVVHLQFLEHLITLVQKWSVITLKLCSVILSAEVHRMCLLFCHMQYRKMRYFDICILLHLRVQFEF